jgi:hypothetical protein
VLLAKSGDLALGSLREVLLDIAETRDAENSLPRVVGKLVEESAGVALAAVWLLRPGDRCASCVHAGVCALRVQCLHLSASGPSHVVGPPLDEALGRVPMTAFDIGRVLGTRDPVVVLWGFWGQRIAHRDTAIGAFGVLLRTPPAPADDDVLRLLASQIGAAVGGERAARELARLRNGTGPSDAAAGSRSAGRILSEEDVRRLERDNLLAALEATKGRVYGRGGAAQLLGLKPTTLASRLKKLGIAMRSA